MHDMSDPRGLTVLEWARHCGLTTDYRASDLDDQIPPADLEHIGSQGTLDLPGSVLQKMKINLNERIQLNGGAQALFVASIKQPPAPASSEFLPGLHRIRNLKLELPLLAADHGGATQRSMPWSTLDIESLFDESWADMDEMGMQGLNLSWKYFDVATRWEKEVNQERLSTPREVLLYLQKILKDPCKPGLPQQVMQNSLTRIRVRYTVAER